MPAKIFLYTDTPIAGGAEGHMSLLAKYLLKDGYEVKIICSDYKSLDDWCEAIKETGVEVLRIKVKHKHDPRHLSELKKILKANPPDIFHLHLWNPGACRYAFFATDPQKTKIIATEHDPFPLSGLKKIIKQKTLQKTSKTIVVSKDNYQKMINWYPKIQENLSIIHNGIELENFEKELQHFSHQEKNKLRTELFQAKTENFIILSIAALHPRKGLIYLIEAFQKIHALKPKTKLVIVGEGPQAKELRGKIRKMGMESHITILPHQTEIPKILKSSDLFVLPSIKEAFGLVLLEAMAAQIPIVASRIGGIPEIIEDQKSGILVEPARSEVFSEKILKLMENKALQAKLIFIASHQVKNFDIKKMVEKTEKLYDEVLPASQSKGKPFNKVDPLHNYET